jgi:hypothetical protein
VAGPCVKPQAYMTDRTTEFLEFTRAETTNNFKDPTARGRDKVNIGNAYEPIKSFADV